MRLLHYFIKSKRKPKKKPIKKNRPNTKPNRNYDYKEEEIKLLGGSLSYYSKLRDENYCNFPEPDEAYYKFMLDRETKQEYYEYLLKKQKDWPYDYKRGISDSYYRSEYQRYIGICPNCNSSIWGGGEHQYFKNGNGVFQHCYCELPAVKSKEDAVERGFMDRDGNLLATDGSIIGKSKPKSNH